MARTRFKAEEIVAKLRQVEVLQLHGMKAADAIRQIGVTEVTLYRWRREYGGMKSDQLKRLKELESEASNATRSSEMPNNQRLRKAVSDLTLDKLIPAEAAKGAEGQRSATSEPCAPPAVQRQRAPDPWRD